MLIRDRIYGNVDVTDQVIPDLIKTKAMQRLKKIEEVLPLINKTNSYNRYQHSVGVMLLLRRFVAPLEEQVSGLLHDLSHTAFSHTIDRVIGNPEAQDYQDHRHRDFVYQTDIPAILDAYGLDTEGIINVKGHDLLEQPLPDICADRIDYALRNFTFWENKKAVKPSLDGLMVRDGKFIFNSKKPARIFAENYLRCQVASWGSVNYNVRDHVFSRILKIALKNRIILLDDLLYKYDGYVMKKLRRSRNKDVRVLLDLLKGNVRYHLTNKGADLVSRIKSRYTDPLCLDSGRVVHLSESDHAFKERMQRYLRSPRGDIKFDYPPEIVRLLL